MYAYNGSLHIWPRREKVTSQVSSACPLKGTPEVKGYHLWNNEVSKEGEFALSKLDPHLPFWEHTYSPKSDMPIVGMLRQWYKQK